MQDFGDHIIGVTAFKAHCLALIDKVAQGKTGRVVLMKHNKPVAAIIPIGEPMTELWGAMRGSVTIPPTTDLTEGTGEIWGAEA